ncbi:hypothetical protein Q1695_012141 [Nippostrongylus brasiliensis]|nr:hypothetical protein Q1695_012140 [Nippostrongylus brasiliensis]WKX95449.1 hypothetical protein Q1695_012141 [Nippostrongylus brasiliensis]
MRTLVICSLVIFYLALASSEQCFTSEKCLPEMSLGDGVSMSPITCASACTRCLGRTDGECMKSVQSNQCSYKCRCTGTSTSRSTKKFDLLYCSFVKNHIAIYSSSEFGGSYDV